MNILLKLGILTCIAANATMQTIPTADLFSAASVKTITQQGGTATLMAPGRLKLETGKQTMFLAPCKRFQLKPLIRITYSYAAEGTTKFGLILKIFNQEGRNIGQMTKLTPAKNGKIQAKGAFRLGEHYLGQTPAWGTLQAICPKNSTLIITDFNLNADDAPQPNTALVPVKRQDWSTDYSDGLSRAAARQKNVPLMFLGDSITIGWKSSSKDRYPGGLETWKKVFEPMGAINYGIAADTISNVLWRVTEGRQLDCKPKIIVLLIGTNNLHHQKIINSGAETAQGIINLVKVIQGQLPKTHVILMGVLPREPVYGFCDFPIPEINAILANYPWNEHVIFRDYSPILLDKQGKVTRKVFRDGVHLAPKTYELLAAELLKDIRAIQKKNRGQTVAP